MTGRWSNDQISSDLQQIWINQSPVWLLPRLVPNGCAEKLLTLKLMGTHKNRTRSSSRSSRKAHVQFGCLAYYRVEGWPYNTLRRRFSKKGKWFFVVFFRFEDFPFAFSISTRIAWVSHHHCIFLLLQNFPKDPRSPNPHAILREKLVSVVVVFRVKSARLWEEGGDFSREQGRH